MTAVSLPKHGEVIVRMMADRQSDYVTARGPGYEAIRLPYKSPSLGMIIVLPDEIDELDALVGAFDMGELARLRAEFERKEPDFVVLELPRFRARAEASLVPALQRAGMACAFDWRRADFSAMTGRSPAEIPVALSDIRHCSVIDVAEAGTEAAGATMGVFRVGGYPPSFIVDRPFLFFIVDESTGAVLFEGRIVDPR